MQIFSAVENEAKLYSDCNDDYKDESDLIARIEFFRSLLNESLPEFEGCIKGLIRSTCYNPDGIIVLYILASLMVMGICGTAYVAWNDRNRRAVERPAMRNYIVHNEEEGDLLGALPQINAPVHCQQANNGWVNNFDAHDFVHDHEMVNGRRQREGDPNHFPMKLLTTGIGRSPREGLPSRTITVGSPNSELFLGSPMLTPVIASARSASSADDSPEPGEALNRAYVRR